MSTAQTPEDLAQATALLERYAELADRLALVDARRARLLARANAAADNLTVPLLEQMEAIAAAAEPWWKKAGLKLAGGAKSMQLGGCEIGSRAGLETLAHKFASDDKAAAALGATRYRKQTTREKLSLDRPATLKLLKAKGKVAAALTALGFRIKPPTEIFFLKRAKQPGALGS